MDKKMLFKKEKKILLMISAVCAVLALIYPAAYYIEPAITGFAVKGEEVSYSDKLSLVLNESSEYIWDVKNYGNIKSIKVSGSLENKGSAKVYIEKGSKKYLIFDSSLSDEKQALDKITGMAVKENKTKPNHPPVWQSDIESFAVNKSLDIDLNNYFYDKDDDILNYSFDAIENLDILIDDSILIINNKNNASGNKTLALYASDNKIVKRKNVVLILLNTAIINETIEINKTAENKTIGIKLEYKTGTNYDIDDNGIETTKGVIDFTVENSLFNWDVSYDNLCARWETYSVENEESAVVCHGSEKCCNFAGLSPSADNWNDIFYSYYGLYGASFNNIVSAQIIYADYNLSIDDPFAEIYISEAANLTADYYIGTLKFDDVCVETCALFDFNETSYNLIFEINDTVLYIDSVKYSAIKETANKPPLSIKNISDISINKNQNYTINLSEYFYDEDELNYDYYKTDNITAVIKDSIAAVIPDKDFTGIRFMFFKANDSSLTAVSNVFMVNVSEEEIKELEQLKAEINKPVKWIKRAKNKTIAIPGYAYNLSINKIINKQKTAVEKDKIKVRCNGKLKSLDEFEIDKENLKTAENETVVIINETADNFEVIYESEPPLSLEKNISDYNKKIVISSEINYTNILAYTNIIESPKDAIKFYWYKNGIKTDATNDREINLSFVDSNNNTLIDKLQWNIPHLSNQTFEVSITVLNVQSYPTVGGNWTVGFETVGTGNLTITAVNGTTFAEVPDSELTQDDLEFLKVSCNETSIDNVFVSDGNVTMPFEAYEIKRRIESIEKRLDELE